MVKRRSLPGRPGGAAAAAPRRHALTLQPFHPQRHHRPATAGWSASANIGQPGPPWPGPRRRSAPAPALVPPGLCQRAALWSRASSPRCTGTCCAASHALISSICCAVVQARAGSGGARLRAAARPVAFIHRVGVKILRCGTRCAGVVPRSRGHTSPGRQSRPMRFVLTLRPRHRTSSRPPHRPSPSQRSSSH